MKEDELDKKLKNKLFINTSIVIFLFLLGVLLFFYGMNALDYKFSIFESDTVSSLLALSIIFGISLALAVPTSFLVAWKIIKPINKIKEATHQIAKGNFDVKLDDMKHTSLDDLIVDFNKMAQELRSIETLKLDFISNVSHEFKTPLSVIQSYSKALRKPDIDKSTREKYEKVIDTNIQKLTHLVTDVLSLSKIENHPIISDKSTFLIDEQIGECIVSLGPKWEEKNIKFDLELEEIEYSGLKNLMMQVWQNLIGNAIKFSHQNGEIKILATKEDGKTIIKICDNGVGMSEETQKHIFDKFYQDDKFRTSSGNGLGLAIVKKILEIHNAQIDIESKEGEGSTFIIKL